MLLEPKTIEIDNKEFVISKFPAIAGREIISQYPLSGLPRLGDYRTNEQIMLKLMHYVGVNMPGQAQPLQLTTQALIDNHTVNWETLVKLEKEMLEYNCSFFKDGRISTFLQDIAQNIPAWTIKILTALSEQSSQAEKQPLES